jgi:hypothetical protein
MCSMAKPIEGEVRKALEEGTYPRAFETAAVVLDGLTLREWLDLTLDELEGGDPVLYDALAARWIAIAQLQGRASLNGVWWLAGRFEEIINPVRRETAELYKVVERNPQSRFRARRPDHLPAVDRDVLRRRTAADLAMLDAALARGDVDAAWEWMTPATPIDRLARLVGLLARRGDERLGAAARRLIVRFTTEAGPEPGRVADLAAVLDGLRGAGASQSAAAPSGGFAARLFKTKGSDFSFGDAAGIGRNSAGYALAFTVQIGHHL